MTTPTDRELLISLISEVRNGLIPVRSRLRVLASTLEGAAPALVNVERVLDYTTQIAIKAGGL